MDLQVFTAPTMSEALSKVKMTFGHNALILHTRTIVQRHFLGLRRREIVEITAGRGVKSVNQRVAQRQTTPVAVQPPRSLPGGSLNAPVVAATPGRQLLESTAAGNVIFLDLSRQMDCLKSMVKELAVQVQHQTAPHVPDELMDLYAQLTAGQVSAEIATDVLKNLQRTVRPEHLQHPDFVRDKLAEQIEKMLLVAGPISRVKMRGPHVVALIGPTGVGKTTTIAKLAANLKLCEKRRVGLITIDTFRIAAVDQLRKYADIIGSNLRVVTSADELRGAVESMNDCEFVLIDTAGRSPNDTLKLSELRNFIAVAGADEVHLVLSATASQECVELAIERFDDVRIDKIIFTKLDETRRWGTLLNVVHKVNKPVSYVTTGQDVPDDIEVARGRRLAQLILGCEL